MSWKPWFTERLAWRGSVIRGDTCDGPPHPIRHISALQCHEWMLRDCAALDLARQQREDSIVNTVTTISAAALLAIPGLLFGKDSQLPPFEQAYALYFGFVFFGIALGLAITEQILSSSAYRKQAEITKAYYTLQSSAEMDSKFVAKVDLARVSCISVFSLALLLSAIGFSQVRSNSHGKSSAAVTAAAAATSSSPSASASAPSSSATTPVAGSAFRLRERAEISAGRNPAGSPKAIDVGSRSQK